MSRNFPTSEFRLVEFVNLEIYIYNLKISIET